MKNLSSLTPDGVCAEMQAQVRKLFGDSIENKTDTYARHGYFYLKLPIYRQYNGAYRRWGLPALFKALAAEK